MHLPSTPLLLALPFLAASTPLSTPLPACPAPPSSTTPTPPFLLTTYLLETTNTSRTLGTFSIANPLSGETYNLQRIPVSIGGGTWSVCQPGSAEIPEALARCQYILEKRGQAWVGFRFQWWCTAGTAGERVFFDATVRGNVSGEVCETRDGAEGVTQACRVPGEVVLGVANMNWGPESKAAGWMK